jgi:hypothetical protein
MGVLTYVYPSSTLNFVTYTAKRWGYNPIITYLSGGVAGQEVVSTDSSHNIYVQIQSGVSTNAQIKAAIDTTFPSGDGMSAGDYVTVTIAAGHSTDTNVPGSSPTMTGAVSPDFQGFYVDDTITPLTSTYQLFRFPMVSKHITLQNRNTNGNFGIMYSWDGINNHGYIEVNQSTLLDKTNVSLIYLKYINGSPSYKLMVKTTT